MSTMNRYKAYTGAIASAKKEKTETKPENGGKKSILARLQEAKKSEFSSGRVSSGTCLFCRKESLWKSRKVSLTVSKKSRIS